MITLHNLGFPRIGARRELKFALEAYWKGDLARDALLQLGADLRRRHWHAQAGLDLVPVGDFSFYDGVLDMSLMLGNLPARARDYPGDPLDNAFRIARGRSVRPDKHAGHAGHAGHEDNEERDGHDRCCDQGIAAGDMTKWFDTNYHYIVPEFSADATFTLDPSRLLAQFDEARAANVAAKPVIVGPVTYLALGKAVDGSDRLALLPALLDAYAQLLCALAERGATWVQVDEPLLVTTLDADWQHAFNLAYHHLKACPVKLLVATYFGALEDNRYLAANLPVAGLHVDAVRGRDDVLPLLNLLPEHKVLSLGVIDGRNVWKTDLHAVLGWLGPIAERLGPRLWLAPSCSLLHVPVDLDLEVALDPEIRSWLAFALQKLDELRLLGRALNAGDKGCGGRDGDDGRGGIDDATRAALDANAAALAHRRASPRVRDADVRHAVADLEAELDADLDEAGGAAGGARRGRRNRPYPERAALQAARLRLPPYPTTTIGSFPQTAAIRQARRAYKAGELDADAYRDAMRAEIARSVREQETLGLDVLVHGEAERNDMVEYFGEQLDGFAFSAFGWVQSYGSRCVKPPILVGDIRRPRAMTVAWTRYAQSLTDKPVKGMLTGPVTILNWSFVRDDQPRADTCRQLALAIREEVLDLERAGVRVIQIDEAALREGLPLRRSAWRAYLDWAVDAFRIAANGVADTTQIHTHMCYSEFNDIVAAIAAMDADVITIETARSDMALLDAFDSASYPNAIGPGVYDIHSPNVPTREHIVALVRRAAERIPAGRLWINPDCGLKTRRWDEVLPALANMVAAARVLRAAA